MWLLKNPFNYDVLVAPNLYGDIISDLCAQMVGGLGFGCSGNIGEKLAVFEPTHGSAPKYAGQYKVNPIATILAAKMMLDWLGETEKAARARGAPSAAVIAEGKVRTYDMGGAEHDARDGARRSPAIVETAGRRPGGSERARRRPSTRSGLRDGLQIEKQVVPTRAEDRAGSRRCSRSGVDIIQVGSFVHPREGAADGGHRRAVPHFSAPGRKPARVVSPAWC